MAFPKGLVRGFGQKIQFLHLFILGEKKEEKSVWQMFWIEKRHSRLSKQEIKNSKNGHFSKGVIVYGLIKTIGFFPSFYVWKNRLGDIQERKKRLSRLKTRSKKKKQN